MDHKAVRENLDIISAILEEWSASGKVETLEYDILLERIKTLYEEVKFGRYEKQAGEVRRTETTDPYGNESDRRNVSPYRVAEKTPSNPAMSGRRNAARALYAEEGYAVKGPNPAPAASGTDDGTKPEGDITLESVTSEPAAEKDMERNSVSAVRDTPSRQVLGEVIGRSRPTIADTLNAAALGAGSVLGREKVSSLRSSIGINDQYMFVRDLFGGDREAYEECIETLDGFTCIEDAMIYIHDEYAWNADHKSAAALCDMLAAKLV